MAVIHVAVEMPSGPPPLGIGVRQLPPGFESKQLWRKSLSHAASTKAQNKQHLSALENPPKFYRFKGEGPRLQVHWVPARLDLVLHPSSGR